jgi:hypothetical protein
MPHSPVLNKIHVEDLQCENKISFSFSDSSDRNGSA